MAFYGNQPGVTQQNRSPQQAMGTFGNYMSLQQAPGPGNNSALYNAYQQTLGSYNSGNGQSNGGSFTDPANNLPGAGREWDHLTTTLYGSGSGSNPYSGNTLVDQSGGGNGSGGNGGNGGNNGNGGTTVTSSITPRPIYSPEDIARNTSQRVAQAFAAGDSRLLQQRFAGRGRSLDSGTASAVMPAVAQAENAAAEARIGSPLQDWYANQNNILQGQVGRAGEALGLANIQDQRQAALQQQQMSMLMPMIQQAMGGY
jgi:hypothetical protein